MTAMSKHASKRSQPWFLYVIAIPAAVEVWACWVGLGSLCGFPVIGRGGHGIPTDWTLAVGLEAYGAYALKVWLGSAPGPRSRKFAQWSSLGAFTLSLIGQVAYHLMLAGQVKKAPDIVVVFVACLVVVVIGFAAILTHLMHADERAAVSAAEERTLQAELAAERQARLQADAERDAMLRERDTARAEVAASVAREATLAEEAERLKADAERRQGDAAKATPARRRADAAPRRSVTQDPLSAAAEVVTLEQARAILEAEPDIAGSELGRRLGFKPSYGRTLKQKVTKATAGGGS